MSVEVVYGCVLTTEEVLAVGVPAALPANRILLHDQFNTPSAPIADATDVAYFNLAMTAGSGAIDLTACPHVNGIEIDGTGKKVKAIRFKAAANNSGAITIEPAVSNGFEGLSCVLNPGAEVTLKGNDDVVGSEAKDLDLSGTGTDSVQVTIVFGD